MKPEDFPPYFTHDFPALVVWGMKIGAERGDAEDIAQEAMMCAYTKWPEIEAPGAWTRKAARWILFRVWRERGRYATPPCSADEPDQADLADLALEQRRVIEVMRSLPQAQREVLALFYDGYSHEEIARIVDKPPSTVRSLYRHARKTLKESIQVG